MHATSPPIVRRYASETVGIDVNILIESRSRERATVRSMPARFRNIVRPITVERGQDNGPMLPLIEAGRMPGDRSTLCNCETGMWRTS
jgi:hypothetical protein